MRGVGRLAVALHAVATSPPMLSFQDYIEAVEALRPSLPRDNLRGALVTESLVAVSESSDPSLPAGVRATDLLAALSSFTDDYTAPPPRSSFAVGEALSVLEMLRGRRCLVVAEQLELALDVAGDKLFDAVLALHTATRVLARGRDDRLHPSFAMSLAERLERGRAIAPFHPLDAEGGDPLGDTYHFWANVAGGLFAAHAASPRTGRGLVAGMLFAGPWLMRGVREATFGGTLFYGDHARIDRLGLRTGLRLARTASAAECVRALGRH